MADIFLSYASEDRAAVEPLVSGLESQGYSVWWDRQLKVGGSFDKQIEAAIEGCHCVLVLWSRHSIDSDWVRAEAGEGLERGNLVQIVLDELRPPLVFRQQQAFRWSGDASQDVAPLMEAVATVLDRTDVPRAEGLRQSLWLVADFNNDSGDERMNGTLARAVEMGLDHLPNVFLYPRDSLLSLADRYQAFRQDVLPLAEREGLDFVLGGEIGRTDNGLLLQLEVVDIASEEARSFTCQVTDAEEVLKALAGLLSEVVETTLGAEAEPVHRQISALELECIYQDQLGVLHQGEHDFEAAIENFTKALERDETFVPSYVGLAISYDSLGRPEDGRKALGRTPDYLDGLSSRERHRTQAMYYMLHSENYQKALEHTIALEKISPLEVAAINNQALVRCNLLDFEGAVTTLARAVQLAPDEPFFQVNLALYCMYAGQFERAIQLAESVLAEKHQILDASLTLCCSLFALGKPDRGREIFRQLSMSHEWYGDSARLGLADLQMASGEWDDAWSTLTEVARDDAHDDQRFAVAKLMQAEVALQRGIVDDARELVTDVIGSDGDPRMLTGAAILADVLDDSALLERACLKLKRRLDLQSRAYARMVEGLLARSRQDFSAAELLLREALDIADLWMLRFVMARFYQSLDMTLEARLERNVCVERAGEGVTAFINRIPTCRYLAQMRDSY